LRAGKAAVLYLFEDYTLDTDRRELLKAHRPAAVQPQVFDLLAFLIANRGRVVTKDEIFEAVWDGRIVSESTLTSRINAARSAIGDSGEDQRLIRTASRKGFRFIGTVRETASAETLALSPSAGVLPPAATPAPDGKPPRLSIVVLPFANLGSDPEQEYFVDGVTESLTTDLSRIRGSFVIGRHTAFSYKGKHVDLKQIGRELNVRYVLEGSIQRSGNRMRVNTQLIDAESGSHLWAERFDKPVAELFEMQDEIVSRLANTLNTQLITAEARRAERVPSPDSMDAYFQGMAWLNKGFIRNDLERAQTYFERALAIDPDNVDALAWNAFASVQIVVSGFAAHERAARFAAAEAAATKALSLAPDHAGAHWALSYVFGFTNRVERAIAECETAVALDRNFAGANMSLGLHKLHLDRAEETEAHVLEALRLSPRDAHLFNMLAVVGYAKDYLGRYEETVAWQRRSIDANPNFATSHFHLAIALAHLGRLEEARAAARAGLALAPHFTIASYLAANKFSDSPAHLAWRERQADGLRKAGLPEE
jgi:TolB-like protein/Tfp pilus assembly protein PilF